MRKPPEVRTDAKAPVGSERILFIDDEPMLAKMTKTMLERLGYAVTVRTDSLSAMELFRNARASSIWVVTDQTMPNKTGMELAREMLQIRPQLPITLCTGYSHLVSEDKIKKMGIKGFALKPLTRMKLAELIREVLGNEQRNAYAN